MGRDTIWLLTLHILFTALILGPCVGLYYFRKHPYIHNRQVNIVLLISFAAWWNGCTDFANFKAFQSQDRVVCWVRIMNQMISGPIFNFAILLRALVLFETDIVEQLKSNNFANLTGFQIAVLKLFSPTRRQTAITRSSISSKLTWSITTHSEETAVNNNQKFQTEFSNHIPSRILFLIFLIFVLLMFFLAAISFGLYPDNLTGTCIPAQATFRIIVQLGIILFTPFLFYLIKDVDDDYNLGNEIGITSVVSLLCFGGFMIEHYSGYSIIEPIGPYFYIILMFVITHFISVIHPVWVVYKSTRKKVSTGNDIQELEFNRMEILLEILDSPSKSLKFKMLLRKQFCCENLLYYQKFQQASQVSDSRELKVILQEIYQNFVVKESPLELDLSPSVRDEHYRAINEPGVGIRALDPITAEVLNAMLANSLPQYLKLD